MTTSPKDNIVTNTSWIFSNGDTFNTFGHATLKRLRVNPNNKNKLELLIEDDDATKTFIDNIISREHTLMKLLSGKLLDFYNLETLDIKYVYPTSSTGSTINTERNTSLIPANDNVFKVTLNSDKQLAAIFSNGKKMSITTETLIKILSHSSAKININGKFRYSAYKNNETNTFGCVISFHVTSIKILLSQYLEFLMQENKKIDIVKSTVKYQKINDIITRNITDIINREKLN